MSRALKDRCVAALQCRSRKLKLQFNEMGYVNSDTPEKNLVGGKQFECTFFKKVVLQLCNGRGNELKLRDNGTRKFCAIHSSAALAVNSFLCFISTPQILKVTKKGTFIKLDFEFELSIEKVPKAFPNLDICLSGTDRYLFIESKLTELIEGRKGRFPDAYKNVDYWETAWKDHYENYAKYKYLDAPQLVKHYLGIRTYMAEHPNTTCELLYLYWEPKNASEFQEFRDHAQEASNFAKQVKSSKVKLSVMSYPQLWEQWLASDLPKNIKAHIEKVRERYWVEVEHPRR